MGEKANKIVNKKHSYVLCNLLIRINKKKTINSKKNKYVLNRLKKNVHKIK